MGWGPMGAREPSDLALDLALASVTFAFADLATRNHDLGLGSRS
jgi:hypothetical protein